MAGVDAGTFKRIFEEHWDEFKKGHPSYDTEWYEGVVQKMLGCGTEAGGTVSTGALIVGRIYGGFVSPARAAFACPALRNTRMIL